jgi:dihydroorotate dehydrogenase
VNALWHWIVRPVFFRIDAERAHEKAMGLFAFLAAFPLIRPLMRALFRVDAPELETSVAGLPFRSPVGLAAGFDKNALWFNELGRLGFGFVEVGTLTAHAQSGNPKPRIFRLPQDFALINRLGFNNRGSKAAAEALRGARIEPTLGINIGKSKVTPNDEAFADYAISLERVYEFADYIAVNVSSPNTQGLRDLQAADPLRELLRGLVARGQQMADRLRCEPKPIFVKIAPDMDAAGRAEVVTLAVELGVAGVIATNTTIKRQPLETGRDAVEAIGNGGLSGRPLTARSRAFVADLYRLAAGRIPIIGVGGVMSGDDAYDMLRAGASLVQVYTGFVYGGPGFVHSVNRTILARMKADGFVRVADVVGTGSSAEAVSERAPANHS